MGGLEQVLARRILFVDEEPEVHLELERILGPGSSAAGSADDYRVDHAIDGREGVTKVKDAMTEGCPYSLVLLGTPASGAWDALDVTERLWRHDATLQVVLCVADSDSAPEAIRGRFGRSGRLFLIRKPFCHMEVRQLARTLTERAHTDRELLSRLGRLELALDGANVGLWDWNIESGTLYLSPRWKAMLGYRDDEVGSSFEEWTSRLHPEDAERATSLLRVFGGGRETRYQVEFRMKHRDGHYLNILSRGLALRGAEGRLVRLVGTHVDITERKMALEALRESEERFRALTENSPDTIMRFDRQHRHLYVNPAAEKETGIPRNEFIGKTHKELGFPEHLVKLWDEAMDHVFETKCNGRVEFQLPKGTWIDWLLMPELSPDGEVRAVATAARDITERKRMEQALRDSEQKYRTMADSLPIAIFETDLEGRFTFVNRHGLEFHGYTEADLARGISNLELVAPEEHERLGRYMAGVIQHGYGPPEEFQIVKRDGSRYPATLYARSILSAGAAVALRGVSIDITERKRAEEQRRRLDANLLQMRKMESLAVMAGAIAHNFNNLLMIVLGHIEMAFGGIPPESPARSDVEAAEEAARKAAELSTLMLTYVGQGKETMAELDISAIAREAAGKAASSLGPQVSLDAALEDGLPPVKGDSSQIRQVLANLIVNSSEAIGGAPGTITLRSSVRECDSEYLAQTLLGEGLRPGEYAVLEVSDDGCGMDEETLARMFDPFFSTKFTGRGLGLAIVLGIVRGHDGTITVYSKPAVGSTVKVLLPVSERRAAAPPVKSAAPTAAWRGGGTILLIDDEKPILTVGQRLLERLGFTVLTAADGKRGVDLFGQHSGEVVCVLLDMSMPGMSGVQVFDALRRIRRDIPVIMASGFSEDQMKDQIEGKHLAGYIQKPYQVAQLVETLRGALGQ